MGTGNKVYIVIENWRIDSGEHDLYQNVFSTFSNALKYLEQLEDSYNIDYETKEFLKDNKCDYTKIVQIEDEVATIEVKFKGREDYYHLYIVPKIVDAELSCLQ